MTKPHLAQTQSWLVMEGQSGLGHGILTTVRDGGFGNPLRSRYTPTYRAVHLLAEIFSSSSTSFVTTSALRKSETFGVTNCTPNASQSRSTIRAWRLSSLRN